MGCDIHMFAEVRQGGRWQKVGAVFPNYWHDRYGNTNEPQLTDEPYRCRNYPIFAALADVRNFWDIVPIAEARGLPSDVTAGTRDALEFLNHTFSWLTTRELHQYDWEPVKRVEGEAGEYAESCLDDLRELLEVTLPCLEALGTSDDVRIVFGFDN